MMTRLLIVAALAAALVGCSGSDKGEAPPPTKAVTKEDLEKMPPQAQAQIKSMEGYGNSMGEQMRAQAEAQKKAGTGR
jgi:PBP1b-binding outer membrane lipoprotein LpoB